MEREMRRMRGRIGAGAGVARLLPLVLLTVVLVPASGLHAQRSAAPPSGPSVVPVLLIPGWGDEAAHLAPLAARFEASGWPTARVAALTFADPFGSSASNAAEVATAVERLIRRTGAARVDIVAHSMGGLAVREYLREAQGGSAVRRVVFLGTPHRGTVTAALGWGLGAREMVPGSPFLERLNRAPSAGKSVEILAIRTPIDHMVIPGSSAMLPGAFNREICCPTHQGLIHDEDTFLELRAFLLNGSTGLAGVDESIPLRAELTW